ncbi:B9 domain-containing protein 1 [Globomyces sp. JEL0801]|nr:B9 domain-containing protein 1 [Globomyces sp. JEL0801]
MANLFSIQVSGQIESANIPEYDNLYCKFGIHHGPDWTLISGIDEGITQLARSGESGTFTAVADVKPCVWNFPIDIAFKSTNVYGIIQLIDDLGWPSILITVYGFDFLGRDVLRGYGSIRIPSTAGR